MHSELGKILEVLVLEKVRTRRALNHSFVFVYLLHEYGNGNKFSAYSFYFYDTGQNDKSIFVLSFCAHFFLPPFKIETDRIFIFFYNSFR